eukprot:m.23470 g.23470  ORF g.23470 m.23470 type:complete len:313 (-) comp3907_c0_seq1:93-1031(-)
MEYCRDGSESWKRALPRSRSFALTMAPEEIMPMLSGRMSRCVICKEWRYLSALSVWYVMRMTASGPSWKPEPGFRKWPSVIGMNSMTRNTCFDGVMMRSCRATMCSCLIAPMSLTCRNTARAVVRSCHGLGRFLIATASCFSSSAEQTEPKLPACRNRSCVNVSGNSRHAASCSTSVGSTGIRLAFLSSWSSAISCLALAFLSRRPSMLALPSLKRSASGPGVVSFTAPIGASSSESLNAGERSRTNALSGSRAGSRAITTQPPIDTLLSLNAAGSMPRTAQAFSTGRRHLTRTSTMAPRPSLELMGIVEKH